MTGIADVQRERRAPYSIAGGHAGRNAAAAAAAVNGQRCVLVVGCGKSGTKRVLKLYDLHPGSHCRCEPHQLAGWRSRCPASPEAPTAGDEGLTEAGWEDAVQWAISRLGGRDSLPAPRKSFFRRRGYWSGFHSLMRYRRLRRVLGAVLPPLRGDDLPVWDWLVDREAFRRSLPVFKLGPIPAWTPWLLQHRPLVHVTHVVRHPAGYLNSYRERWLSSADPVETTGANRGRLRAIAAVAPRWADIFGDIDRMTVLESELWYWRYAVEETHCAGEGRSRYQLVRDEDVVSDAAGVVRRLYERCDLDLDGRAERYVRRVQPQWRARAAPWRELLRGPDEVALVQRVLDGSPMHDWWDEGQRVSRCDYVAY